MRIGDLVFVALFLSTLVYLARIAWAAVRRRPELAVTRARRLGIVWAAYWVVLFAVSLTASRRTVPLGQDYCSDDWCISVTAVSDSATPAGAKTTATFRLSSRARRVSQREKFVVAHAITRDGRRVPAEDAGSQPPFDARLGPQSSITTLREFSGVRPSDLVAVEVGREGGGNFPACCIIGEDNSLLHKRAWFVLSPPAP